MLTDREAEEIERRRREGVSGGPIVLAWVDPAPGRRKERVRQLQYLWQRLNQAFRYLDGLLRDVQISRQRSAPPSRAKPLYCPSCGQLFARACPDLAGRDCVRPCWREGVQSFSNPAPGIEPRTCDYETALENPDGTECLLAAAPSVDPSCFDATSPST